MNSDDKKFYEAGDICQGEKIAFTAVLQGGKYQPIIFEGGSSTALRYGEPWLAVDSLDNLTSALVYHCQGLSTGRLFRHRKTGGVYELLGECKIESDWSDGVMYRSEDGTIVVRSRDEFFDGRFEELPKGSTL